MKKIRAILAGLAALAFGAGSTVSQAAQLSSRTYVSVLGADNAACSVSAPCRLLQAALVATAAGGEVHVLTSGDYGPVNITKAITIASEGSVAGIYSTTGIAVAINAAATDVISLRGLEIDGGNAASVGIQFNSGQSLNIQKSVVRSFVTAGILFAPGASASIFVSDTTIANNQGNGIAVSAPSQGAVSATISKVNVSSNGAAIYASGAPLSLIVTDSVASNNAYGIAVTGSTAMIRNSTISNNTVGLFVDQAGTIRMGQSFVTANNTSITATNNGQVQSFGNNNIAGNGTDGPISSVIALK